MGKYGSGYTGTESPISRSIYGAQERGYVYSDLDFVFNPSPAYTAAGLSGDVVRKYDADSIKQSVKNIVLTNRYERPWKPTMGCNIRDMLFQNFEEPWVRWEIQSRIRDELQKWEPRITVQNIFLAEHRDYSILNIQVDFTINPIGGIVTSELVTVKIQMERLR